MLKTIMTVVACFAILTSGYLHGLWTERFGKGEEPIRLAALMAQLPLQIGDWEGQDTEQKASSIDRMLTGSVQRRYTHAGTGQSVTIAILCGRPGPICIHTPDACYRASGYDMGKSKAIPVPDTDASFWMADATRVRTTETSRLRIFWGWSHNGTWESVADPRSSYASQPALLKMYVLRELNGTGEKVDNDACLQFLQDFVPVAKRALFSSRDSE